jgi:hypothetical protein
MKNRHHSSRVRPFLVLLFTLLLLVLACGASAGASDLRHFASEGCSIFPDGTIKDRTKWCACCFAHDIAYWQGGTGEDRKKADKALRDCVLERTKDNGLAETMHLGVRAGGHPAFLTWYRWGYGWSYGRRYKPLSDVEKQQVREALDEYAQKHPAGYCNEHGKMPKAPS